MSRTLWFSFKVEQCLPKDSALSLIWTYFSDSFRLRMCEWAVRFFKEAVVAVLCYFSLRICCSSRSSCQVFERSICCLSYSSWAMSEISRQDMTSLRSLGSFFLQRSSSCFSTISFSYFTDLISRRRVASVFFCYLITVFLSWRLFFNSLISFLSPFTSSSTSFSLLFICFLYSSSLPTSAFLNLCTSSSNNINSPFLKSISSLNSVKNPLGSPSYKPKKEDYLSWESGRNETSVVLSELGGSR